MPQMAIEALSENWLFKELGSRHWDRICEGLGTPSFDLKDDIGNRLYSTFIRIRIQCTSSLADFQENEEVEITGDTSRFGNSLYYSKMQLLGRINTIQAELLTSFSIRNDSDNHKLVKSQPASVINAIPESDTLPGFAEEYRLVKKGVLKTIPGGDTEFTITEGQIFETVYRINAYYDLNGVGLLYFAAYPVINDFCEAQYFNREQPTEKKWEQTGYTVLKDIFYYANCNLDEEIVYRLHSVEYLSGQRIKLYSSMHRKSDNVLLATVFSIKTNLKNQNG